MGPPDSTLQQPPAKRQRRTASELHTSEYLSSKKEAADSVDRLIVTWLREKAPRLPGYGMFRACAGKMSQNSDIVQSWKFVDRFIATHAKTKFQIPVCVISY